MNSTQAKERQGIQSIEVGSRLLRALAAYGRPMMLRDLAKASGMAAAKAHRYLVSLMRIGLVEQDQATGRYDLGSFALELGLAAMARLDPVRLATPILEDLCERLGETVALAVWGNQGATVVRLMEAGGPITVTLRTGTVLPLATSATGRAFAAFFRSPYMRQLLDKELKANAEASQTTVAALRRELDTTITDIRNHGISRASGSFSPGINGFSAPVFNHTGNMVAAVTSLGPIGNFDNAWNSDIAEAIREAAATLSKRLGYARDTEAQESPSS
ncbi:MAG TPA: IclR family transcriptional regulator [Azospira sp.]|nr:IclR family transcriptional regulator [Azospira sp.]